MFRSTRQIRMGNRTVGYGIIALFLCSCYVQRPPCPAYVDNAVPAGTYDYNGPYECSRWYEHRYGWMWASTDKNDALDLWWRISARPMDFKQDGEFRFTVTADDGFVYSFWRYNEARFVGDTLGQWQYIISTDRDKKYWKNVPI